MSSWREKFQTMAMAVAFAEEGEWETAKSFLKGQPVRQADKTLDNKKRSQQRVRKQSFRF